MSVGEEMNSRVALYDSVGDCEKKEDETRVRKERFSFHKLCNAFIHMKEGLVDCQKGTGVTNCEEWPCDEAWSCLNGADESNCGLGVCHTHNHTVPCVSPYNFTLICLPISRANDGIVDCLGSSDERSFCRSSDGELYPYRCWNDSKCISTDMVCKKGACQFENIHNPCQNGILGLTLLSMELDYRRWSLPREIYFFVENAITFPQPLGRSGHSTFRKDFVKKEIESRDTSAAVDIFTDADRWKCNRGIPIEARTRKKYDCFCPPSYYGDHCQFQSQRVSLTLQLRKICAPSCFGVFGVLATLFDHEQVIHSQEQITYIPTIHCQTKFNIYLLYGQRPKDLNKHYAIRVDIYNKINMSYHAFWIFPVPFKFLPVNRTAALVILPHTSVISRCSKFCAHGQCSLYVNTGKEFCLCEHYWSGEQCTIPLNCTCSSDSLCLGVIRNRSTCLCPMHKSGPRCLLSSVCQSKSCQVKGNMCVSMDNDQQRIHCLCSPKFLGDKCEETSRLEIVFSQVKIPQALSGHFILAEKYAETRRFSTSVKVRLDAEEATLYLPNNVLSLAFVQIQHEYYIAMVAVSKIPPVTKVKIDPSRRCPHIRELVDQRTLSYPLLRRAQHYHRICRQRLDLLCFHDEEELMCLCTAERHANCFNFDFNMKKDCLGISNCKNGAQCFQDDRCPTWTICVCPECFYGSECQFTSTGSVLSLDVILGYSVLPDVPFSRQSILVKVSTALTAPVKNLLDYN